MTMTTTTTTTWVALMIWLFILKADAFLVVVDVVVGDHQPSGLLLLGLSSNQRRRNQLRRKHLQLTTTGLPQSNNNLPFLLGRHNDQIDDDDDDALITKDDLRVLLQIDNTDVDEKEEQQHEHNKDDDDDIVDRILRNNPSILKCRMETIIDRIIWLEGQLGLNRTEIAKLVASKTAKNFKLAGYSLTRNEDDDDNYREIHNLRWLKEVVNLTDTQVSKAVRSKPNILAYSIERMESTVGWLRKRLNISSTIQYDESRFRNLIAAAPVVLGGVTIETIDSKLDWFQQRLMVDNSKAKKMLLQNPSLMNKGIENLESKYAYLKDRLDLSDEQTRKLLATFPNIFAYSVEENIAPKLSYLNDRFFSDDNHDEGLSNMVLKHPSILGYRIDRNIEPKIEFFANNVFGGGGDKEGRGEIAALRLIGHDPKFLSYSLENRLQPRLEEIQELGLEICQIPVSTWVKYSPARWEAYLERKIVGGTSQ